MRVSGHRLRQNARMSEANASPIGVFDSGVGGLTVLKALREALPAEHLVYLGDTARLPYGTKSPQSISRYALQATESLLTRGIKLLVVACNTASAVALDALTNKLAPLPVVGVVEPGAMAAVAARPAGRHVVLATEATVRLGAYTAAIRRRDAQADVSEIACEMLVALAEEGWTGGDIATAIVRRYLQPVFDSGADPDALILGCTHFPILRPAIESVVDTGTAIVDSASTTADAVRTMLESSGRAAPMAQSGRLELLATDGATRFARIGGQFLGEPLTADDIEIVDL